MADNAAIVKIQRSIGELDVRSTQRTKVNMMANQRTVVHVSESDIQEMALTAWSKLGQVVLCR